MLFSKSTKTPLNQFIEHYLPAAAAAGTFSALDGLSGTSFRIDTPQGIFHARKMPEQPLPGLSLHRYQRVLRRLPTGIGPQAYFLAGGWLLSEWLPGSPLNGALPTQATVALLTRLHHQRLFGWRVSLAPLLAYYWQQSRPDRRSLYWLRTLQRLFALKEPKPLRVAPLHMDVHAGNILHTDNGLRLIDWEYAGDGDIGLELATVLACNQFDDDTFLAQYADSARLALAVLNRQVARWQPWISLLVASWYECRFLQTKQSQFAILADNAWQTMRHQEKIWVR